MTQISAALSLKEALAQANDLTEVRDEKGAVIGYVMSHAFGLKVQDERRAFYKYLESLFPKSELEEARNSKRWHSTEDVLKLTEAT